MRQLLINPILKRNTNDPGIRSLTRNIRPILSEQRRITRATNIILTMNPKIINNYKRIADNTTVPIVNEALYVDEYNSRRANYYRKSNSPKRYAVRRLPHSLTFTQRSEHKVKAIEDIYTSPHQESPLIRRSDYHNN